MVLSGYLRIQDADRERMVLLNRLLIAYEKLQSTNRDSQLLTYISIEKHPEIESPYPCICPTMFSIIFNEGMKKYDLGNDKNVAIMLTGIPSGLRDFICDLEKAVEQH